MRFPRCDMRPSGEGFYCQCIGCEVIADGASCQLIEESEGIYRYDGDTPHGGDMAYLYFTDSEGNLVSKVRASYVEIRELTKEGKILHVDFGIVDDSGFIVRKNV